MTPFYLPPKRKGEAAPQLQDVRSLVIVGANGTGKTRMAAWIENKAGGKAHRIAAQRSLEMVSHVDPKPHELAISKLYYGSDFAKTRAEDRLANRPGNRWRNEP